MTKISRPFQIPMEPDVRIDPGTMFSPGLENACLGLDIGSTTVKAVLLDNSGKVVFSHYGRHNSDIRSCAVNLLEKVAHLVPACGICVTGSGGIALASRLDRPFIQEVLACELAVCKNIPDAEIVIELGGEDAKITFRTNGLEQRMNETCAGGTGAFIDQMAAFLRTDTAGLDRLALDHDTIYPIASRCGVFAKSDLLPLLNEGCSRANIAASIMQAVVNQTISGLAQGRQIKGKVVFLGGPLHFLTSLRQRFIASLPMITEAVFPEHSQFFVAFGAAIHGSNTGKIALSRALNLLLQDRSHTRSPLLPPLFTSSEDYAEFKTRHADRKTVSTKLENARGSAWLGIDCGSTTLKAALVGEEGKIIYSAYGSNKGDPLKMALRVLEDIHKRKNPGLVIRGGCATGYGSALISNALRLDMDEVETVAHFAGASFFAPDVSYILDIGGQDIKCMRIKDGMLDRIVLNEACSAGCGSFIENFADSLDVSLDKFVKAALFARRPVDLGSRCTVFMNSRVKQAQKEGAELGDIAAGLCWAVVRNALFKVLKINDKTELGGHVVAQGGAFLNDALLRALELELGVPVTRPVIAGLMGAFGAALIARKRLGNTGTSSLLQPQECAALTIKSSTSRCSGCSNRCLLTVSTFSGKRRFVSGNRCEKPVSSRSSSLPNLYAWKYERLFNHYNPLPDKEAFRGVIGLPRALNMFENYPLWFTVLTHLGFRVELSAPTSRETYSSAFDTMPSQTVCYPAKLAHAHLRDLAHRKIPTIFFPCVPHEQKNAGFRHGLYNCPVVAGYPELLALNIPDFYEGRINYIHEFLPLDQEKLPWRLGAIPFFKNIPHKELVEACAAGFVEMAKFRQAMALAGEKTLAALDGKPGIVIVGHPYHIDPGIHHGIAELASACGVTVFTEDSVAHLAKNGERLRVVNQWAYHSRLYEAAGFAASTAHLGVLQLTSFGCGIDSITSDQIEEIVRRGNGYYAQIKIDEGANLGQARIRIRSMLAAMREKASNPHKKQKGRIIAFPAFERDMRQTRKLLIPQMSPTHFQFAKEIFAADGYDAELLNHVDRRTIDTGLRHVNNDACFPAIVVIGQLMEAIKTGGYDPGRVALVISQTGGCCRATNYIALLRKALADAGLANVPIANFSATMHAPGIRLSPAILKRLIMAGHYGDALLRMLHRMRPYEKHAGSADALAAEWSKIAARNIEDGSVLQFQRNILAMIREFDNLQLFSRERRPRVGLVGEILLKYHPDANNNATALIEAEGGEVVSTDIMDFMIYCFYGHIFGHKRLAGSLKARAIARAGIAFLEATRFCMRLAFRHSRHFSSPATLKDLCGNATKILSLGHQYGEGWLLGSEMIRMLESNISAILCMQPFGCLPNHIVGKGIVGELKRRYPHAAITAIDYDAGASEVNQINRIKLMMRGGDKR